MSANIVVEGLYKIFGENPEAALRLLQEGLTKDDIFSRTGMTVGVENANVEIAGGEIFVVMGLSGSGKSTLIRMFNRLIEPTAGSIRVGDQDVTRMDAAALIEMRRRQMAMVFQSFALLPNRTVYENASFGLEISGVPDRQRRERTMQALESVGLSAYAESPPQALSGGMQQRVGLARALATDPSILLMDEAFSALDPLIRAEMQDQLLELQGRNARTVIFVSHDLDEALKIGDRIAIMQQGRLVQVASPTDILRHPANDYVRAFFRGVDVSQVFTLGQIARRVEEVEISDPEIGARDALDRLEKSPYGLAPVLDGNSRLAGIVTERSLSAAVRRDRTARCRDALVPEIEPLTKNTLLADALGVVAASRYDLPVTDAHGAYLGLVTASDLLLTLDRRNGQSAPQEASGGAMAPDHSRRQRAQDGVQ